MVRRGDVDDDLDGTSRAPVRPGPPAGGRVAALDALRGVAVLAMILTHASLAFASPAARAGAGFSALAPVFALPSRLFVGLLGVGVALRAARGDGPRVVARRGLELFGYAYALRLWDYLSRGATEPTRLFKVDVLNAMGAAALVLAALLAAIPGAPGEPPSPRTARARRLGALGLGLAAVALGAWAAAARPEGLPVPAILGAYVAGPRPLAHFPLAPWFAYAAFGFALVPARGLAAASRPALARLAAAALALGLGVLGARAGRAIDAEALAREADVGLVLGSALVVLALAAGALVLFAATPRIASPEGALARLGRASLPVYLLHLGLCFGPLVAPFRERLSVPEALVAAALVAAAMAPVVLAHERVGRWRGARRAGARGPRAVVDPSAHGAGGHDGRGDGRVAR